MILFIEEPEHLQVFKDLAKWLDDRLKDTL